MISIAIPMGLHWYLGRVGASADIALLLFAAASLFLLFGRRDTSPLDRTVGLYLGVIAVLSQFSPLPVIRQFFSAGMYASLCLMAFLPLVVGRAPFTEFFAMRRVRNEADRKSLRFKAIVHELAWIWAFIFAVAFALAVHASRGKAVLVVTAIGIPFSVLYPKWRARHAS